LGAPGPDGVTMYFSVQDWLNLLRSTGSLAGLPLAVAGAGLMLFGWRLWRVCTILSFGAIGAIVAGVLVGPTENQWLYAIMAAVLLAAAGALAGQYSIGALAGLLSGGISLNLLSSMGFQGSTLWLAGGVGLTAGAAFGFLYGRHVVILMTAFEGAILVVSGFAAMMAASSGLYGTLRWMATSNYIVLPFMLLVPTVVSFFYQVSEVHRVQADT